MVANEFKEPTAQDFQRYEASVAAEREQAQKEHRERQRVADQRNKRITRPPDYVAPITAEELKARIAGGESYFYGTILVKEEIGFPLDHMNFESSVFQGCTFGKGCSLRDVIFRQSRLSDCTLADGVSVSGADFENARIERVKGLYLDDNNIKGAMFEGAPHPWLVLRAAYGPQWQMYHVLFGFAYFLPILGKIIVLSAIASLEAKVNPSFWQAHHFNERSLPSLIFHESGFLWYLALLVLAYQALRAFIAYRMAPLIQWQNETGFAPSNESYSRYDWLHLLVRLLSFFSIIAFFVQLWVLTKGTVYLPTSATSFAPQWGGVFR